MLTTLLAFYLSGCGSTPTPPTVYAEGEGVLAAGKGRGTNSVFAPTGEPTWSATFGAAVLCIRKGQTPVRLTDVRVRMGKVKPLSVKPVLRTFTPDQVKAKPPQLREHFLPNFGLQGEPPAFIGINDGPVLGTYTSTIKGTSISQSCEDAGKAIVALNENRIPAESFTELMTVVTVDAAGGSVDKAFVDYTLNGQRMTLRIDWATIACGTRITPRSKCQ